MTRLARLSATTLLTLVAAMPAAAQDSGAGLALWNANACSACHTVTLIRGNITARAPTGLTYQKSLDALNAALTGTSLGNVATGMQGFAAALTTANRADLAAYIANLPALAPIVSYAPAGGPQFPATAVGSTSSQTVTITNTGTASLIFATNNAVTIATGGDAADFRVTSTSCAGITLMPNTGSCTINVTFQPQAGAASTRTASLGLSHNANGGSSLVPMLGVVSSGTPPANPPPTGSANPPSGGGGGGAISWPWLAALLAIVLVGTRRRSRVRRPLAPGID